MIMRVLRHRVTLVVLLLASTYATAQRPPLCDVDCGPDPRSGNYGGAVAARPKLLNARGYSSKVAPQTAVQTVNMNGGPATLSVTLVGSQSFDYTIPIVNLPGRAGLDLALNLYYNSRVWDVDTVGGTVTFNADRDSPSYGFRLDFGYLEYDTVNDQYILTEADGTKRALPNTSSGYQSNDSSFIAYNPGTKTLTYSNGTAFQYVVFPSQASTTPQTLFRPAQIKDANGNYISIAYVAGHDQFIQSVTDTLGRVIHFNYDSNNRLTTITQNVQVSTVDPGGVHTYVTFAWGTLQLNYSFASTLAVNNTLASGSPVNVLTGCTYANGTGYRFTYGDWGIITKIENLSVAGATRNYVSYNYPLASAGALSDAPAYTQETISPDGTSTFVWNYSVAKSGTGAVTSMTVTDPNGNLTVTNLDSNGRLSSIQAQNSSGTALRTTSYTWTTVGVSNSPLPSIVATTLNDTGQQSSIQFSYDSSGNATDVYEYDFGGQLKRHTVSTYLTTYATQHILNLLSQITVKDGQGNIGARTDFAYDTTALTLITGAAGHDDAAFGTGFTARGNVTSVTRYSNAAAGTGGVTRTFNYDTLGNLLVAQMDCCNQKTFSFSSGTQYAYADSVVRGPSSGPQFTSRSSWNFDKGLMLSSTDENGQVTSYQYDSMNRRTQVSPPSPGAQLNIAFNDSAISSAITASNTANNLVEVQTFDGLGHMLEADKKNGSTLVSTVAYSYDGAGQRIRTSNPYGPSDTPVYTTSSYDPLGRLTQVSPPSGGPTQYQYSGNTITITDPAGTQRKSYTDALDHLIEVDEPGETFAGSKSGGTLSISGTLRSQSGVGAAAGSGSVTISGSEQCSFSPPPQCQPPMPCCIGLYSDPWAHSELRSLHLALQSICDSGTVKITVNGHSDSVGYGSDTPSSIAINLANAINADSGAYVRASASGGTVYLTAKTTGAATNYTLSSSYTFDSADFGAPSFTTANSGSTLTGGADGSTVTDSGTVTVTIGSFTASTSYGPGGNTTAAQVASALVSTGSTGLNRSGSPVTATVSASSISLTYNSVGGSGNLSVSATSAPNNSALFPGGSFSGSTSLTGGKDAYSSGLAHPYVTTYSYDVLDDLTSLVQAAGNVNGQPASGQSRSYSYDSLGRTLSVNTPESGTLTNYYTDINNNSCSGDPTVVCQIRDARGVIKTFTYDAINRVTSLQYSDGTPGQTYSYDTGGSAAFALGRLVKITDGSNSQAFTYDNLGRITTLNQVIDSITYVSRYAYNGISQPTSITYPTNRIVSEAYDAIGRLASVSDGTTTYLNGLSFNAGGGTLSLILGNGVQGAFTYNDHLQVSTVRYYSPGSSTDVLNLSYDYGTSNTGQVQAIHYYTSPGVEDPTKSEYFSYDAWSRLSAAHTGTVSSGTPGTWSLAWVYDRLGNRLQQNLVDGNVNGTGIGQPQFTIDANSNRITNTGFSYDAAGNLTADGTNTYAYDGANRLKQLNNGATAYTYFGPSRIKKASGASSTVYIYSGNKPIVEYANGSISKEYIYAGTKMIAEIAAGAVIYHHPDHLSNRADTNGSGSVTRRYGHAPFGENWYDSATPASKWKFTTYERDSESGLDYAQFRYYASTQGRFTTPDFFGGDISSPQSLNRYAYAVNNPVNFIDPRGLECYTIVGKDDNGDYIFGEVPCPEKDGEDDGSDCDGPCNSGGGGDPGGGGIPGDPCGGQPCGDGGGGGGGGTAQNPPAQKPPVYCDPKVLKAIEKTWMAAVLANGGFSARSASSQKEAGFSVADDGSGGYSPSKIRTGDADGSLKIPTPDGTVTTFHTHLSGTGMPSTPNDNVKGSKEAGDSLMAFNSGRDVYVISANGLAVAPASTTDPQKGAGSHFVAQGSNFGDWFKALQKLCGQQKK